MRSPKDSVNRTKQKWGRVPRRKYRNSKRQKTKPDIEGKQGEHGPTKCKVKR